MNGFIGDIVYFGAPKDGFKVYPDLGARSSVFSGYYSNTETDWILIAKKSDKITRYTYVRYGLLTATVDGRTGSCFGISIDLINHYFTDLKVFRTQIVEGIWEAILEHKMLLDTQEASGRVAFKSYDLYDVSEYLEELSKKIREVIADEKYSNYIRPSYEIPSADDNPIYGLHPDSSPSAINEYFRTYGVIKLSPKLPVETKSFAEKQKEHKKNLQEEVQRLTEQLKLKDIEIAELLKRKDSEIETLNKKLENLKELFKPIYNEFSFTIPGNEVGNYSGSQQSKQHIHQAFHTPPQASNSFPEKNKSQKNWGSNSSQKTILIGGSIFLVSLFAIAFVYNYLSEGEKPHVNNANINQPTSRQTPNPIQTEPILVTADRGRLIGFLKETPFLEKNKGIVIFDEANFKEVLTSYLFKVSPEVEEIYNGNKDSLWNKMMDLNPTSKVKISDYIKKRTPFTIENNSEQQGILKDLVIFTKSSQ